MWPDIPKLSPRADAQEFSENSCQNFSEKFCATAPQVHP
ncbi:hypothetical protein SAMN06265370_101110 [Puniceibacterium sediminis]|uniref:Uncharacterized protein n=1 Tax=Puniceibacterium sediminis TaxID=1608407 RepID=A0A238UUN4_9RHOB|nr:hypothetical protein SAMN06265370_101110 [Puniceibacterium sediminis]